MSRFLNDGQQAQLVVVVSKALDEYLDLPADPYADQRKPLAEYIVDEMDDWIGDRVSAAIDLDRRVGG